MTGVGTTAQPLTRTAGRDRAPATSLPTDRRSDNCRWTPANPTSTVHGSLSTPAGGSERPVRRQQSLVQGCMRRAWPPLPRSRSVVLSVSPRAESRQHLFQLERQESTQTAPRTRVFPDVRLPSLVRGESVCSVFASQKKKLHGLHRMTEKGFRNRETSLKTTEAVNLGWLGCFLAVTTTPRTTTASQDGVLSPQSPSPGAQGGLPSDGRSLFTLQQRRRLNTVCGVLSAQDPPGHHTSPGQGETGESIRQCRKVQQVLGAW